MSIENSILLVHPEDNIVVALRDLKAGESFAVGDKTVEIRETIKAKHKFALINFAAEQEVIMYGVLVGKVTKEVNAGEALTVDNLSHAASSFKESSGVYEWQKPDLSRVPEETFMGFKRSNGKAGTANYWLVIPLVFCENRNLQVIQQALVEQLGYVNRSVYKAQVSDLLKMYKEGKGSDDLLAWDMQESVAATQGERVFENVDGVQFLYHDGGCGGTRHDSDNLCALLAGYVCHPNVAGATVLSLGCQHAQISIFKEEIEKRIPNFDKPLYFLEQQEQKLESKVVSEAIKKTFVGLTIANKCQREEVPVSELTFGVECGASDGFSGISANPAIGYCSDINVAKGGSVILSEFPELCGVEQDIVNRCVNKEVADRFMKIIRTYEKAASAVGASFDMNPSPGNIKDGLITDAIKSAGAALKGGRSPVCDALYYTEMVTKKGLNLLCTPGNDVESTTALAGSGANVILFSTGLGTPTGNPIVPVVKVASNTKLAETMPDIIDVNTGPIITGERSLVEIGEEMYKFCLKVASGEVKTKAVILGQNDFLLWKRGISL